MGGEKSSLSQRSSSLHNTTVAKRFTLKPCIGSPSAEEWETRNEKDLVCEVLMSLSVFSFTQFQRLKIAFLGQEDMSQ